MKLKRLSIISLILISIFSFGILSSWADNAGIGSGTDSQMLTKESKEDRQAALKKQADSDKMMKIKEDVQAGKAKIEDYEEALSEFKKTYTGNSEDVTLASIIQKVLGVSTASQEQSYYCGPASAYMLLKYKGVTKKATDSSKLLSQYNLANDLGTNTSQQTSWPGTWKTTLTNWLGYTYYVTTSNPTESNVWNNTVSNVDGNYPVIYDTVQNSTNGYLPGYSSGTIYHYICGDGYQNDDYNYKQIHYVDPNGYRSGTLGPHWTTANKMYKVVKDRGMVW